ncbi:MAG: hypothetical protein CFE31_00645 [Rhizobiales bacterium PAR1]|nr:MAG: hypothetical protein CFE31_00645 [Rhizobiales bacterium PAR1]
MKRSHVIALGASGLIAVALVSGHGDQRITQDEAPKDAAIYANAQECIRAGVLAADVCEVEFQKAAATHVTAAPKFTDQTACENQYGASQCRPATHNGSSVFVPAMVGFMVGNYLSNQRNAQPLLPPNRLGAAPCPPGITPAMQPGCLMPRQASTTSSSGSSGSSSSWRSYSTSNGSTVSRTDAGNGTTKVESAATHTSARSTSSSASSSTATRGGFGSTGHATASASS